MTINKLIKIQRNATFISCPLYPQSQGTSTYRYISGASFSAFLHSSLTFLRTEVSPYMSPGPTSDERELGGGDEMGAQPVGAGLAASFRWGLIAASCYVRVLLGRRILYDMWVYV
jgi:hypothetical protein